MQLSVLTNLVGGRVRAAQISFAYNRGRTVEGLQVGAANRADEAIQGLQAGVVNLAESASSGAQLGLLNFAGDISGLQLGLVNVAGHVKGMQLGLVNVAEDVDGVPIGLVSVTRDGGVHPVLWSSNTTYANIGVKFATRYTYTMLSAAGHSDGNRALYGGGLTIGTSIPIARRIDVELDVGGLHLFANTACCRDRFVGAVARASDQTLGKFRALGRFELLKHLSLFTGIGATGKVTYPLRDDDTEVRFTLVPELFGGGSTLSSMNPWYDLAAVTADFARTYSEAPDPLVQALVAGDTRALTTVYREHHLAVRVHHDCGSRSVPMLSLASAKS